VKRGHGARETEESLLLEAVARKRLVKTLQAGSMVICELWRLAVALYLLVVLVSISIHQSKPLL
jgi:hypothetical protein